MKKNRIIVVDDEESVRKLLGVRLEREGFQVHTAESAVEAESLMKTESPVPVVITDLKMPIKDGFSLLATIKKLHPDTKVIMITGHGEKEAAIRALRDGASDYLEKPFNMDELAHTVHRCIREVQLQVENKELIARLEARVERLEGKTEDQYWYVSKSPSMAKVNEWLTILRREAMRGNAEEPSVLVLGESGTGKEGIARMIHAGSRRAKGPWIALNCANFHDQLLESELFGHEKGSFTGATSLKRGLFEIARGGTIFLDEIGEMDSKLQAKLLRVLQEKTFRRVGGEADLTTDVRVVAATNRNLQAKVQSETFRLDLYHRLARVVLEVPALRERKDDIIPMANIFAERAFLVRGKRFPGFTPEAEVYLGGYNWPGNVRELLNISERLALINQSDARIEAKDLELPGYEKLQPITPVAVHDDFRTTKRVVLMEGQSYTDFKKLWTTAFEKEYLVAVLKRNQGSTTQSSKEAKLDRSNFLRLLRKYKINAADYRPQRMQQTQDEGEQQAA